MRKEMQQVFKRKVAPTLCAALMTVAVVSARPAVAKDGRDHDQQQQQQQQQVEPPQQQQVQQPQAQQEQQEQQQEQQLEQQEEQQEQQLEQQQEQQLEQQQELQLEQLEEQLEEQQLEQQELRLTAILVGVAPFNGAFGFAEFEQEGTRAKLQIEVEDVNLPDGTMLDVLVNGNPLAGVTLPLIGGKATLVLDSTKGQTVPMIGPGSTIAVTTTGGATVVHGMF
jgi:flagellar motor protein MotB